MGDFPTHWHDYEGLNVVVPIHILDCLQPECSRQAELARRGCYYDIDYIRQQIARADEHVNTAIRRRNHWQLILEAKERTLENR